MFNDKISDYFEGVAAKYLSAVDADTSRSNQHEIGGLPKVGFKQWLGQPGKGEKLQFSSRQVYITDQSEDPTICDGQVSWYDTRHQDRSPEYRLYYTSTPVTEQLQSGDFFLVAKRRDGGLLMVFTPANSTVEMQLRTVFGLPDVGSEFKSGVLTTSGLLLPLRLTLESLGFEFNGIPVAGDGVWLDRMIEQFGGANFPSTAKFSDFARTTLADQVDPLSSPDDTLMGWMEHEEKLFRIYERHLVQGRLRMGFGPKGDDVDEFIGFSLSVQNRRKSRVGHAFEGHLNLLFSLNGLKFEQGGKNLVTENRSCPDFLFPSFRAYHDRAFPASALLMLGAKTTCKDRWRQVLSEANRITAKHLVTLEAAISESQTGEMESHHLSLVVPQAVHATYTVPQQNSLMTLGGFISFAKANQEQHN